MTGQREVTDADATVWTCVQAYAGIGEGAAAAAAERLADGDDVAVVCTPGGGARSVRVQLPPDWLERTPDDALLAAIAAAQAEQG